MPINIYPGIGGVIDTGTGGIIEDGFGDLLHDYIRSEDYVVQKQ